jgi:DNA-binding response OmpR family regulator
MAGTPPARPSVLVVEDDDATRAMLGFVLHDAGFDVREAVDGVEAMKHLTVYPPDCVVLDLMLPGIDGMEVLRVRRDRGVAPDTRVIVLTAKGDPNDAVWCWKLGADEFLVKPVAADRITREVRALIKRSTVEQDRRRQQGLADAEDRVRMEQAFSPRYGG